ncbi:hypothetical protein LA303_06895 [Candidatus Sulfidibacterium hydrothermale]|uniref:hypothetical protein n=1 Tax=Candidatus Sulfidibacterium hydrothermale TaxID=2875962 RepID=UPI001F0AC4D8|nr:hypothetical protein [Candidatus Sulfidibacterium hydrothermale]UBM61153.1 hypothetical protein LA303_06895 [Candidatus Sulfidibacterium hydrothermale]
MKKHISLAVKCPHCGKSLMDKEAPLHGKPSIRLNIQTQQSRGVIHLCSYYECFDYKTDVPLAQEEIVTFSCPHCNKILNSHEKCKICDAPMVSLLLQTGGRVSLCSRTGCSNHYVAFEDVATELQKFYEAYGG